MLQRASWALISRSHWAYMASMKGSPDRAQGQSGLVTGKLKEELKMLALSAAIRALA